MLYHPVSFQITSLKKIQSKATFNKILKLYINERSKILAASEENQESGLRALR